MKTATAKETGARVSFKYSLLLARKIKGKKVDKVKKFLEDLINQKRDVDGQYHTNITKKILELVKSAEANAKNKNMNAEKLFIKNAYVNKAEKRVLPKSRLRLRGREGKGSNIEIVLEER